MISLLYPIRNRLVYFQKTIESIKNKNYPIDIINKFEIIVLDSGSEDDIKQYVLNLKNTFAIRYVKYSYPNIQVPHNPAYAFNLGSKLARYNSIVLTSPEIIHKTDVISQLLSLLGNNILGKVVALDKDDKETDIIMVSNINRRRDNPGFYFIGMYNKFCYNAIGGIDERFMKGLSYEDVDFGLRFKKAKFEYRIEDGILGLHQLHPTINLRNDPRCIYNSNLVKKNIENHVVKVNEEIKMGNEKYIKEII